MLAGIVDGGVHAVRLYRLAHRLEARGSRWARRLAYLIYRLNLTLTGADIPPTVRIGANFLIPHPVGVVLGRGTVIGDNVKIMSGVVMGSKHAHWSYSDDLYPTLDNDVFIGANAVIVGPVTIGAGAVVGACAVVTRSVPPYALVRAPEPVVESRDARPEIVSVKS